MAMEPCHQTTQSLCLLEQRKEVLFYPSRDPRVLRRGQSVGATYINSSNSDFLNPRPPTHPPPAPPHSIRRVARGLGPRSSPHLGRRAPTHCRGSRQTRLRSKLTTRKRRWKPLIVALLAMDICVIALISVSVYMGVMSTNPVFKNSFWCGFINSLPKSLVSGAFVFTVALVGMTHMAQRWLQGVWMMLLYSFFLFMMGSILETANRGLNVTVVVCTD
jgi:hypothetical protein